MPGDRVPTRLEIRRQRRDAARQDGSFVTAMRECMAEYRKARAAGVSQEDACKGIEAVIRDVWPKGRDEPWHYVCEECQDTGLRSVWKFVVLYQEKVEFKEACVCAKGRDWAAAHSPDREPESDVTKKAASW